MNTVQGWQWLASARERDGDTKNAGGAESEIEHERVRKLILIVASFSL